MPVPALSGVIRVEIDGPVATVTLADAARRNALGDAMFDGLEAALERLAAGSVTVLRLRGDGAVFCAGFDLGACIGESGQATLRRFLERLSRCTRALRRGPWIVVAEVQGAALAGGCALLAACDLVCAARTAQFGYPVHRLGVSPAVTAPLLRSAVGDGAARALLLSGDLIDGTQAARLGLVHRLADDEAQLGALATALVDRLVRKGPQALLATKRWLNELEGSDRDEAFDRALRASAARCGSDESLQLLESFWARRRAAS